MADNDLNEAERALDTLKSFWAGGYWKGVSHTERELIDKAFVTLAARRTPVADGAAVDLPPLPTPDEHFMTSKHVYTAEQYKRGQREAISHYLRKQAGQVIEIKRWKDRLGGTDEYGREYQRDIDAANHEIAHLRAVLKRVLAGQEGEQPTINKGKSNG